MKIDFAAHALALVGTRFRHQGRGEGGLDCVGVILSTFDLSARPMRRNYALSGDHLTEIEAELGKYFRRVPKSQARSGDVLLFRVSDQQWHLGVQTDKGFVHAHAGLRRVVETPATSVWPIIGVYRRRRSR